MGLLAAICALLVICPVGICRASNAESKTAASAQAAPVRNSDWAVLVDKKINLYRVTPTFYRSAQFKKTEVAELEKLGIRTSVDLRKFHADTSELKGSSIKQVRLGTNTWSIGDKTVIAALVAIRLAEATGPVVLHCEHGADRTGLVTAMYRIVYQGWTKDAALDELLNGGYGYHPVWKNIPEYLRNVDIEKIKKAVDRELAKQGAVTSANAQASPKELVFD
jgi:protein tyrosine/serine phosphatase